MTTDRPSPALPAHSQLWLGKAAPRYTSYPPATQFKMVQPADLASAAVPAHLEEIAHSSSPISLYLHIPFCRELCLFLRLP
jgi:oxygen-independent coproporphyrinogen-3 oxidase